MSRYFEENGISIRINETNALITFKIENLANITIYVDNMMGAHVKNFYLKYESFLIEQVCNFKTIINTHNHNYKIHNDENGLHVYKDKKMYASFKWLKSLEIH